ESEPSVIDRAAMPEPDRADLQQIAGSGAGARKHQLGVARRVLGIAMMPGMEIAVEGRVVEAQHAGDPAHGTVEAGRGEGGTVGTLLKGAELLTHRVAFG